MTIEEREELFKNEVFKIGDPRYTNRMIQEFIEWWTEKNRAKGKAQKMRFEREKTWETSKRMSYWARRTNAHNPYLSSAEKTILAKKREFANQLKPFLNIYGADMLNEFYRYWAQPENKAKPEYLRWENEDFWELSTRLKSWSEREANKNRHG
jgi:hypothetical protein